ncbi:hypothetical protein NEOLI_003991 [Neolecta irregularis DAH-3]|uniref:PB1 domain-containing protein n=1 Tax=Neolecta irregularis (strain DAH-3) TaxID=1198029 RepID=A0A1U7LKW8_NEOID|nr:hypothetical protein NEOLI_003991 [Neolecta irregularis DAH-3]|eukprot:OLL23306.1 hypothetical protein NEOLI_003991 [Neolecta irregularis DAH-3]
MATDISFDYIQADASLESPVIHAHFPAGLYSSWIDQLRSQTQSPNHVLTYTDEEGDEIIIGSEEELCLRIQEIQGTCDRTNAFLWKRVRPTGDEYRQDQTPERETSNEQHTDPIPTTAYTPFGDFVAGLGADLKDLERNFAQESKAAKRAIDDLLQQVSQVARNNARNGGLRSILTAPLAQIQTSIGLCGRHIEHTLSNSRQHYANVLDHFAEVGHPVIQSAFETLNVIRGVRDVDSDEENSFHSVDEEKNEHTAIDVDEPRPDESDKQPAKEEVVLEEILIKEQPEISNCAAQIIRLGYFEPTDFEGAELTASIANYNIDTAITNIEQEREAFERFR